MVGTWTATADEAALGIVTAAEWDALLGASGNLQYLYERIHERTKYKTATQVISASTTLVDVTASSGNLALTAAANEVWLVEWWIPLTFTGTGGVKFQVTGPAAPTAVTFMGLVHRQAEVSGGARATAVKGFAPVTSFASNIAAGAAEATQATIDAYYSDGTAGQPGAGTLVLIRGLIRNGANAGAVTLQVAQNSANGTTTIGAAAHMRAERLAA